MLNKKRIELSYRIHLKLNLSDTHISWKGYLIGSLTPNAQRVLKYNCILIYDFTIIETGRFNVFL
jgi:hypothetical protein